MSDLKQFRFVRVDDRLLHGQVALGWRQRIDPRAFWIVDDDVADDPLARSLYRSAIPEGAELLILALDEFHPAVEEAGDLGSTILLIRGLGPLYLLCEHGFRPEEVNLGGLHAKPGAKKILDYIHLTAADLALVRILLGQGIGLYAQDLPGSPRRPIEELLSEVGL